MSNCENFRKGRQNVLDAYGSLKMALTPNDREVILNGMMSFIEEEISQTNDHDRLFFYYGYRYQLRKLLKLTKSE